MNRTMGVLVGGLTAAAVTVGSWIGLQEYTEPRTRPEALRGYDATNPASTAPQAENVFTGIVRAFEELREIEGWEQGVYRVEVVSALRGSLHGTVRVTYAPEDAGPEWLETGGTYVFATHAWTDVAGDGHAQLFKGEMRPVDAGQLSAWEDAVALPLVADREPSGRPGPCSGRDC
ncbi:hypothetical protein ACIRQY_18060 [Streptomyces sp. NPDC101490]|uniref:hypothetical protein n=2 Tax=unclassified Streptomyces TaxID=2593676 RepID=UPI003809045D